MNAIVLCSGGLDSTVLLHEVSRSHSVLAGLSFDYGSKHNARELPFAAAHCRALGIRHETVELGFMDRLFSSTLLRSGGAVPDGYYTEETMKATVVPFRNGILLSVAAGFAESVGAEAVMIGAHAGDHVIYPDCREPFMEAMAGALKLGTDAGVDLLRPFIAVDKSGIVQRGAEMGVDFSQTWSCYKGGERHCGACGTCVERREAFFLSGVDDPTEYESTGPLPGRPGA